MIIEDNDDRKKWDRLFEKFTKQVYLKKPVTLDDYLDMYLKHFGFYYQSRFIEFCLFLQQKGFGETSCRIEEKIIDRLNRWEKELFDNLIRLDRVSLFARIDTMTGDEFEAFICWLFRGRGYQVSRTKTGADQGVDLIYNQGGSRTVVQIRRRKAKIGNSAVQAVFSGKSYYQGDKAMVITNSYFTKSATTLAKRCDVELWNRDKLLGFIKTT